MFKIDFPKKFSDKELDKFIDSIYRNHEKKPADFYIFDLTGVEFIGNQELLVLSALFKSFNDSGVKFKVIFFKEGTSITQINERVKRQIVQFWDVWKIYNIAPINLIKEYFGIDGNSVQRIKEELKYYPELSEIYNRHGVTPFITLSYINNYNEGDIKKSIAPIYNLNAVINDLLSKNNCDHPFTSNSLSTIITEELYLNFLDHSIGSSFKNFEQSAFMSISFHSKLDENKKSSEEIQNIKKLNFYTECLEEVKDFYFDSKEKIYYNRPYIQFSFLDFGHGIAKTLREQYLIYGNKDSENVDSDILRFAFNYNSSRHPLNIGLGKEELYIPRGLFDALSIVRRYKGLMVVRSNFGKIIFNFDSNDDLEKSYSYFGNNNLYFPGTLITLYIPAVKESKFLNTSTIKPEVEFATIKPANKKYLNLNLIARKLDIPKDELYASLINELKQKIYNNQVHSILFVSFKGFNIEKRIIKKTLYFLLTDYDINHKNNVVVMNSPGDNIIDEIADEILSLNHALRNYKIHPLPIIDFDKNGEDINVRWLGIYDDYDRQKLRDLLFEQYSIARSDFVDPTNVTGQLNEFDSYGNFISNFPNKNDLINFFKYENQILISEQVEGLLEKYDCIKKDDKQSLYLCSGNYYQKEYIELSNLLNDKTDCNLVSKLLYDKIKLSVDNLNNYNFIGITASSHKILKALEVQGLINSQQYESSIDNYYFLNKHFKDKTISVSQKYILVCDVISTGFLAQKLNERLVEIGTSIEYIAVITSILDDQFSPTINFLSNIKKQNVISLFNYPILKYRRNEIGQELFRKKLIRINPYTNIPIKLNIDETNFKESIIYPTTVEYLYPKNEIYIHNEFLNNIDESAINIGYYKFNNVIHPYFFNTKIILEKLNENTLKEIFNRINNPAFRNEKIKIFFPRKSGIEFFNFYALKNVFKNQHIEEIEIERFGTSEGWRFPHNTDYFSSKIADSFCLILDDGSCSGDSLIQMIDEISFYDAKEIVLLCIIGRVPDHKREFFSRISQIKVKKRRNIPLSIHFVCHWHIPTYYLDDNPNSREVIWLEQIINLQNTPRAIKKIAKNILAEIKPKDEKDFSDYKYLPRIKETGKIPKKELMIVRDEIGKVIGYRLYSENFKYFDCFIKKYQNPFISPRYFLDMELLCASLIYEPYLFDKIRFILPDVTERIEQFVSEIILSDDNKIFSLLCYDWKVKDILHLFFIVYKDEKLIAFLSNKSTFKKLIEFSSLKNSNINYVLYNLLKYFPLSFAEFNNKNFDSEIRTIVKEWRDDIVISTKEVKKYSNFISTLPSREDFESQLEVLVDNYFRQQTPEYHLERKSFDHNVSKIIGAIRDCSSKAERNLPIEIKQIDNIIEKWFGILDFVNPILQFSITFPDYLIPYPYFNLISTIDTGLNSIRGLVGSIEKIIFSMTQQYSDFEKLNQVEKNIVSIQSALRIDGDFYNLIKDRTCNIQELFFSIFKDLDDSKLIYEVSGIALEDLKYIIKFPKFYAEELIRKEIITNFKNHCLIDGDSKIKFNFSVINNSALEIAISNKKRSGEYNRSNLEGIKCLELLSDSTLFEFSYTHELESNLFKQKLIFNIT